MDAANSDMRDSMRPASNLFKVQLLQVGERLLPFDICRLERIRTVFGSIACLET